MSGGTEPLRFVFGIHVHQPVGNFDVVFEEHVRDVYRPFLERVSAANFFPLTLHVSGPLLEWLEAREPALLDQVGRIESDGRIERLLAGCDEPVLAALPRADRLEQIGRMRELLHRRFGVNASGLWLTERVWEPELAADLAAAGVLYTLVDDRHFLAAGFHRDDLHRPYRTESNGQSVTLLAIDERLRYLIPFRPPEETAALLRRLRADGHALAVLADDGEKFGGWPGTKDWVYGRGWLDSFFRVMSELQAAGEVRLVTAAAAVREVPTAGLAYLGTASYREMEGWSLPPDGQRRLAHLEAEVGAQRMAGETGALVRGSHWRNFLVRYAEANRMHKTMVALSDLSRAKGDPPTARRAIGRAQCNDAYWHGVFGGLYLPHLRGAIWQQLAIAEAELRRGEPVAADLRDLDGDGWDEIWVHSSAFSAVVSPRRGGAVETLVRFAERRNVADTLTRRYEAYHDDPPEAHAPAPADGVPSIHDLERARPAGAERPPVDREDRALLVDRVLSAELTAADYAAARYTPVASWARVPLQPVVRTERDAVVVELRGEGFEKILRFAADGALTAQYAWYPGGYPAGSWFAPELSLAAAAPLLCHPAVEPWRYEIRTVAKSERGLRESVQGIALTPRWPIALGAARLELPAP